MIKARLICGAAICWLFALFAAVAGEPAPACPSSGAVAVDAMCLTPAERADGQTVVHSPTLPDAELTSAGITLTIRPGDHPVIPQSAVEAMTFLDDAHPASVVLGEMHTTWGSPTRGRLVWVLDITNGTVSYINPGTAGPTERVAFSLEIVDAMTGQRILAIASGVAPGDGPGTSGHRPVPTPG